MAKYATNNQLGGSQQNLSSTYKTLASIFSTTGATRRGRITEILVGTNGTPANNELEFDVSRMTADGTGTAVTPLALDPADVAALATSKANYTAEPTVTANSAVFYAGLNQQLSYRWAALQGGELVYPSTANSGLVLRSKSAAYTSTATGHLVFDE